MDNVDGNMDQGDTSRKRRDGDGAGESEDEGADDCDGGASSGEMPLPAHSGEKGRGHVHRTSWQ